MSNQQSSNPLVERLRANYGWTVADQQAAADEIERLTREREESLIREARNAEAASREIESLGQRLAVANTAVERLRADAERWRTLPMFLAKYQIDYVGLKEDIDAETDGHSHQESAAVDGHNHTADETKEVRR